MYYVLPWVLHEVVQPQLIYLLYLTLVLGSAAVIL